MVSIRNEKFVKYEDNLSVVRVRINVDSADELPETDDFSGKILYQGSTARDLSTGDLYALTSSGEWIKQSVSSGGQGTDNYNDLSNKPSINNVTLQGNKSLSDLGTYSKAEIDGMTEIETIELIHDETENKQYFPADKRYILEEHRPFYITDDGFTELYSFSYTEYGTSNIICYSSGTITRQRSTTDGESNSSSMMINDNTLEISTGYDYSWSRMEDGYFTALQNVEVRDYSNSKIVQSENSFIDDTNFYKSYLELTLYISGTFAVGDSVGLTNMLEDKMVVSALLKRNNTYSVIQLYKIDNYVKTNSALETGDIIYIKGFAERITL